MKKFISLFVIAAVLAFAGTAFAANTVEFKEFQQKTLVDFDDSAANIYLMKGTSLDNKVINVSVDWTLDASDASLDVVSKDATTKFFVSFDTVLPTEALSTDKSADVKFVISTDKDIDNGSVKLIASVSKDKELASDDITLTLVPVTLGSDTATITPKSGDEQTVSLNGYTAASVKVEPVSPDEIAAALDADGKSITVTAKKDLTIGNKYVIKLSGADSKVAVSKDSCAVQNVLEASLDLGTVTIEVAKQQPTGGEVKLDDAAVPAGSDAKKPNDVEVISASDLVAALKPATGSAPFAESDFSTSTFALTDNFVTGAFNAKYGTSENRVRNVQTYVALPAIKADVTGQTGVFAIQYLVSGDALARVSGSVQGAANFVVEKTDANGNKYEALPMANVKLYKVFTNDVKSSAPEQLFQLGKGAKAVAGAYQIIDAATGDVATEIVRSAAKSYRIVIYLIDNDGTNGSGMKYDLDAKKGTIIDPLIYAAESNPGSSSSSGCDLGFGLVAVAGLAALALRKRSK